MAVNNIRNFSNLSLPEKATYQKALEQLTPKKPSAFKFWKSSEAPFSPKSSVVRATNNIFNRNQPHQAQTTVPSVDPQELHNAMSQIHKATGAKRGFDELFKNDNRQVTITSKGKKYESRSSKNTAVQVALATVTTGAVAGTFLSPITATIGGVAAGVAVKKLRDKATEKKTKKAEEAITTLMHLNGKISGGNPNQPLPNPGPSLSPPPQAQFGNSQNAQFFYAYTASSSNSNNIPMQAFSPSSQNTQNTNTNANASSSSNNADFGAMGRANTYRN